MLPDQPDSAAVETLRRALATVAWRDTPTIRLRYVAEDDVLIARFLPLDGVRRQYVHERLCVDFDGHDPDALPTALALTGFLRADHSPDDPTLRLLLGDLVWRAAVGLSVTEEREEREICLSPDERDARLEVWQEFARRPRRALGVAVSPDEVRAVLADEAGRVVERWTRRLDGTTPATVVAAVRDLVGAVRLESPAGLVVGVTLGGPVSARSGTVYAYRRPAAPGPSAWENAPLAELVARECGVPTAVLNDVDALAMHERWFGLGTAVPPVAKYAVLLVSDGVGGALVRDGEIDTAMPMELGTFVVHPGGHHQGSVESTAAVGAIVEDMRDSTGVAVRDLDAAALLAERDDEVGTVAAEVFHTAGRDLGAGVAAAQVLANPSAWAVHLPAALRTDGVAAQQFRAGLEDFVLFVAYKPFRVPALHYRTATVQTGAIGAALAALERHGISSPRAAARPAPEHGSA